MYFQSVNHNESFRNADLHPALQTARSNKYLNLWLESRADNSGRYATAFKKQKVRMFRLIEEFDITARYREKETTSSLCKQQLLIIHLHVE